MVESIAIFKDYRDYNPETGKPRLALFIPSIQNLEVDFENVIFPRKLVDSKPISMTDTQSQNYDDIVLQLEKFHQTEILSEKYLEADRLFDLCNERSVRDFPFIQLLMDQLLHFMDWCHQREI